MSEILLEKPPRLGLGEHTPDLLPITEIGDFTLRAYLSGMLDEIDAEDARNIFEFAAKHEQRQPENI